jgi:hypothetical protein
MSTMSATGSTFDASTVNSAPRRSAISWFRSSVAQCDAASRSPLALPVESRLQGGSSSLGLAAVPDSLFAFNPKAVAAELSSATNDEYLVHLEVAWTGDVPPVPDFVPVHSGHPALEEAARSLGIPYERDMEIPVEVAIKAVETELERQGCQLERSDNPPAFEVLARWTWPPLT